MIVTAVDLPCIYNNRNAGVRGVSDSPEVMAPQSLAPKDQMTPPPGENDSPSGCSSRNGNAWREIQTDQ